MMRLISTLIFSIAFVTIFPFADRASAQQKFVRQSVQEFFKDPNKVSALFRGIQEMKRRNSADKASAEYRTSWEYWANIHGYAGPGSPNGTIEDVKDILSTMFDDFPLFAGFFSDLPNQTPPDALAEELWGTCTHGGQDNPHPQFLTWHRIYLYFFERVLRDASGDPSFALPYWDYTNPAGSAIGGDQAWVLPSIFGSPRVQTAPGTFIENVFYEKRRTSNFASLVQVNVNGTNIDPVLKRDDFQDFLAAIESGIHAYIHCAVGNGCRTPYIGIPPFAGNDPIFWLHHANIDRLWECWSVRHGKTKNPVDDSAWMEQKFAFVNETGARDEMAVKELFDPAGRIDYTYDNVDNCLREPDDVAVVLSKKSTAPEKSFSVGAPERTEVAKTADVKVVAIEQSIPLRRADTTKESLAHSLSVDTLRPTRALLTLNGVTIEKFPGTSVQVYLENSVSKQRDFVAVIGFFGWLKTHGDGADHHAHAPGKGRSFSYDVTASLRRLTSGDHGNEVSVVFVGSDGLGIDGVAVSEAPKVNEKTYITAGLAVAEVLLEVETTPIFLKVE